MTPSIRLREAKALLAANKLAEANNLIETVVYSLLNAENPRQAARVNLVFLGRLQRKRRLPTETASAHCSETKCPQIPAPSVSSRSRC